MKPCPFKHAHPEYTPDNEETRLRVIGEDLWFWVYCPVCDSTGPQGDTKDEAIERWNNRS
jgi:hypothetical protein